MNHTSSLENTESIKAGWLYGGTEEAEQQIIGKILWDQKRIIQAKATLKPDDFRYEKHRVLFRAILKMEELGIPIDVYSLWCFLKERGELEDVGGSSYLTYLPVVTIHDN